MSVCSLDAQLSMLRTSPSPAQRNFQLGHCPGRLLSWWDIVLPHPKPTEIFNLDIVPVGHYPGYTHTTHTHTHTHTHTQTHTHNLNSDITSEMKCTRRASNSPLESRFVLFFRHWLPRKSLAKERTRGKRQSNGRGTLLALCTR